MLGIVIDQFRYDYLTRFRTDYNAGFDRLLKDGAVFTSANYMHCPTVTAIGHSTFLTGATPSRSGIAANEWYDRATGKVVTSVSDDDTKLLPDGEASGASPRRLLVDTVGDEMKAAWDGKTRVIGISLKDRSAILTVGHKADGAYWFDAKSGVFVSSTYYFPALPAWAAEFDGRKPADAYAGAEWTPLVPGADAFSKKMPAAAGPSLYKEIDASPYGNDLVEAFAESAIEGEQLGRHEHPDLLAISFSSNDYVGHQLGPDSPEVRDMSIRTDRLLAKLFAFVEAKVGLQNVLIVLTSDHGVAPMPEVQKRPAVSTRRRWKPRPQTLSRSNSDPATGSSRTSPARLYLNRDLMKEKHVTEAAAEDAAAKALRRVPHVMRVYTREQILGGKLERSNASRLVKNGFVPDRSADVVVLLDPYYIAVAKGATHGSVNEYDTHVPVIFLGPQIKPGTYAQPITPNDIAPTVASILGLPAPNGIRRADAEADSLGALTSLWRARFPETTQSASESCTIGPCDAERFFRLLPRRGWAFRRGLPPILPLPKPATYRDVSSGRRARSSPSSARPAGGFLMCGFEDAKAITLRAYELGINYFDCARIYWDGKSEEVYGEVLPPFRKHIFLTTQVARTQPKGRRTGSREFSPCAEDRLRRSLADSPGEHDGGSAADLRTGRRDRGLRSR